MLAEAGVSYLIEDNNLRILFDTGFSDAFIRNADRMGEDLLNVDYLVCSHGHVDHTWGLSEYVKLIYRSESLGKKFKRPQFLAHPMALMPKRFLINENVNAEIGPTIKRLFKTKIQKEPYWFNDNLVWLGEIERTNNFENQEPIGKVSTHDGKEIDDYLLEDTAFAYKSKKGLVIITACSHPGICNIIEYAKKVTRENKIYDVLGGFHLQQPSKKVIEKTVQYLKEQRPEKLHACHCTDLKSKIAISEVGDLQEVGSGLILEY